MENEKQSDFAQKAGDMLEQLLQLSIDAGKKGLEYLQSIDHIIIMRLDADTIALLDKVVSADLAQNRRDAVRKFMEYGFEFRKDIIEKINATEKEIDHLKEQILHQSGQTVNGA